MLQQAQEEVLWDVIIIGGGATGLGSAVDSATRGYKTLLLEQSDFAKGTSSRSTKLIHGGLRYLQQGNIGLVMDALKERGRLCKNAPHLVSHLPFLVPLYKWWERPYFAIGLKTYDLLAGKLGIEKSKHLNLRETRKTIPSLCTHKLRGSFIYYDGQFDDARLAITLAQTAADHGATLLNYAEVKSFLKRGQKIIGVKVYCHITKKTLSVMGRVVINATGVFSDRLRHIDEKKTKSIIRASQGTHIVLPKRFMKGKTALLIPHTDDGRVIFIVPWQDRILVGTTDHSTPHIILEPKPQKEEIAYLLKHAARYLTSKPCQKDILSVFSGLRPLIKKGPIQATKALSRDHTIIVSRSRLITITGGKWTTYRKMAEDVIDRAAQVGALPYHLCQTKTLKLSHHPKQRAGKKIHPRLPYTEGDVIWAVRSEMALTLDDILSRRTRSLLLDAQASIESAPRVAKIMAKELKKGLSWIKREISAYRKIANAYVVE
jgi:glycerol-3-phosphate dehydrogenase